MKKILTIVILLLSLFSVKAQTIKPHALIGKTFIVDTLPHQIRKYGYHDFVKDIKKDLTIGSNMAFTNNDDNITAYDSLANQKFLCVDAGPLDDVYYDFYLKLKNYKGIIYFLHHAMDDKLMYLYTAEEREQEQIALKKENDKNDAEQKERELFIKNPCLTIEKEYDEFHNTTTFSTPGMSQHEEGGEAFSVPRAEFYNVLFSKT